MWGGGWRERGAARTCCAVRGTGTWPKSNSLASDSFQSLKRSRQRVGATTAYVKVPVGQLAVVGVYCMEPTPRRAVAAGYTQRQRLRRSCGQSRAGKGSPVVRGGRGRPRRWLSSVHPPVVGRLAGRHTFQCRHGWTAGRLYITPARPTAPASFASALSSSPARSAQLLSFSTTRQRTHGRTVIA